MTLALLIYYFSSLIWVLPPVKQYGGKYFNFFLILALSDIISIISYAVFHHGPSNIYVLMSFFLLLSLIDIEVLRKNISLITGAFILVLVISFAALINLAWLIILFHLGVMFLILRSILLTFIHTKIRVFHILLVFYELTIIFKFIFAILEQNAGYLFFYLTTLIQILFAIAFMIFSEGKKTQLHNG